MRNVVRPAFALPLALPLATVLAAVATPAPAGPVETAMQTTSTDRQHSDRQHADSLAALLDTARRHGTVPVLARLDVPPVPPDQLTEARIAEQAQAIAAKRQDLFARLGIVARDDGGFTTPAGIDTVKTFTYTPIVALHVDAARLQALAADPAVTGVELDAQAQPMASPGGN